MVLSAEVRERLELEVPMSAMFMTNELVFEVRAAAKAFHNIIDCALEILADGIRSGSGGAGGSERAELEQIRRDLTGDLVSIARLVASGRPEDLKEARGQANLLVLRCDVTVQTPPISTLYDSYRSLPTKAGERGPTENPHGRAEANAEQKRQGETGS